MSEALETKQDATLFPKDGPLWKHLLPHVGGKQALPLYSADAALSGASSSLSFCNGKFSDRCCIWLIGQFVFSLHVSSPYRGLFYWHAK